MSAIKANSAAILASGDKALRAVVRVGEGGRGFVVEGRGNERYVVTAAHCLPRMPQPYGFSRLEELTYRRLLAPLGGEPSVSCLCLFVDPISDLTVLGMPDDLEPDEEAETYEELVAAAIPLVVAEPRVRRSKTCGSSSTRFLLEHVSQVSHIYRAEASRWAIAVTS